MAPRPIQEIAPWVSPEVAAVVHGALRIDPKNRFPTAAAMLDAIKAVLPGGFGLRTDQLVGVSEHERAQVAPKFAYAITEAGMSARFGSTGVPGRSIPPPSESVDGASQTNDGVTPPLSAQEAPRLAGDSGPRWPATIWVAIRSLPRRRLTAALSAGATDATAVPRRRPSGATSISARLRSIADRTAFATS